MTSLNEIYEGGFLLFFLSCLQVVLLFLFYQQKKDVDELQGLVKKLQDKIADRFTEGAIRQNLLKPHAKYRAQIPASGGLMLNGKEHPTEISNVSKTGILFLYHGKVELEIGGLYQFRLRLNGGESIDTSIKVVRAVGEQQFGASFQGISVQDAQKISSLISEQAEEDLLKDPQSLTS